MQTTKAPSTIYGELTGPAVGIVLKELVRRALMTIRAQRLAHDAKAKNTPGRSDDVVTSADFAAQAIFVRGVRECFPGFGIIGEENNLNVPCTLPGIQYYLVFDPLDGTKAYARRQSGGVASQIALVRADDGDGGQRLEVVAAYVADVTSGEIYGYRPDSAKVHRISDLASSEYLSDIDRSRSLRNQAALTRCHPQLLARPLLERLLAPQEAGGLAKSLQIDNGSMSLTAAKLWKGEVGFLVNEPFRDTPWDTIPVVGIHRKLGFVAVEVTPDGVRPHQGGEFDLRLEEVARVKPIVWIHSSRVGELEGWVKQQRS